MGATHSMTASARLLLKRVALMGSLSTVCAYKGTYIKKKYVATVQMMVIPNPRATAPRCVRHKSLKGDEVARVWCTNTSGSPTRPRMYSPSGTIAALAKNGTRQPQSTRCPGETIAETVAAAKAPNKRAPAWLAACQLAK